MASSPITLWQREGEKVETVKDFIFLGSKITVDSDCSHEIKRCLLLGRSEVSESGSIMSNSLHLHGLCSPWNSLSQNTGVCSVSLLQGIFPTQGSNPGFPHYGQILYQLSHNGSPRILEWVAYPFSRGISRPGN